MTTNPEILTVNTFSLATKCNVNDLCRLCLNATSSKVEIFGSVGQQMNISGMLWILFNCHVLQDDRWPQNICTSCCEKLTEFHGFYSTIKSTEATLVGLCGQRALPDGDIKQEAEKVTESLENYSTEELKEEMLTEDLEEHPDDSVKDEHGEEEEKEIPTVKKRSKVKIQKKRKKLPDPDTSTKESVDSDITKFIQITCDLCSMEFPLFEELKKHFRKEHKQEGYVMCCNRRINTRSRLMEHMYYHRDPKKCECNICGKIFHFPQSIQRHLARHVAPEEKKFKCDQCPKVFATSAYMRRHKRWHAPAEEKQKACPVCNKIFASLEVMKMHVERVHEMKDKRVCEICAKVFKCRESFAMHQLKHTGKKPPERECEHCGKKFTSRSVQRRHMENHGVVDKIFSCDICGKDFLRKYLLQKHKFSAHRKKLFKCGICEKEFKQSVNLREHIATHTGQQSLYKCNFCDKMFNSNANRYVHQKRNHPHEWEEERRKKLEASGKS